MSDENQSEDKRNFELKRIYLKDVSFETPNSPRIFLEDWTPKIEFQLGTETQALENNHFEVVLKVTVTCTMDERTAFLVEIHQGGIFVLQGFSDQEMTYQIGSHCPQILFPYAREAVSDLVSKGGFPQFLLTPVNFDHLLAQHMRNMQAQRDNGN
ncbi:MAG: protein-export chaperone SecB [Gammaproteobacteria bacterium]|nr:protein-export chaperone SecB [Gammaproteobacteria bacterium]MBU1656245.1 protein-export chaperone SecB [Gammaproteobacteria bacterium]MBU1959810.1 protein-export chaperone SecB [Gammaproteobacteria bacterium]